MITRPIFIDDPDLEKALSWRNAPQTRACSFRSHALSIDELKDSLFSSEICPLWVLEGESPIGVLYFEGEGEIGIFLDPSHQGTGWGARALREGARWAFGQGVEHITALIKEENRAAIKAFKMAGFELAGECNIQKHNNLYKCLKFKLLNKYPMRTFVIAEIGSNFHVGSYQEDLEAGKKLILQARQAGASAVKFQLYDAKSVYAKGAGSPGYLKEDIHEIFDEYALSQNLFKAFHHYAERLGIEFMCSAFSEEHFEFVDPFVKRHKIASYEIRHKPLIELAARSGKPLILSSGASTMEDIAWAKEHYEACGGKDLTLLHCNAQYPAEPEGLNLRCIQTLKEHFGGKVGFSDHSRHPTLAPTIAVSLGACVIEKHVTLSRKLKGPDHGFAIEPNELFEMLQQIKLTESMLGVAKKEVFAQEEELAQFAQRGLHALCKIEKGETFALSRNIGVLRPGNQKRGLHPKHLEKLIGNVAKRSFRAGEAIEMEDL